MRLAVEAESAEEGLELELDHASATLREIVAAVPPSPRYVQYHEAYLRRLRRYTCAVPPGSMERHSRRVAVLHFCQTMMEGKAAGITGEGIGRRQEENSHLSSTRYTNVAQITSKGIIYFQAAPPHILYAV